jgi:hypothetical protein
MGSWKSGARYTLYAFATCVFLPSLMFKLPVGLREVFQPIVDAMAGSSQRPVQATVPSMVVKRAHAVPLHEDVGERVISIGPVIAGSKARAGHRQGAASQDDMTWDPTTGRYRPTQSRQAFTDFAVDPLLAGGSVAPTSRSAEVVVIDAFVRQVDIRKADFEDIEAPVARSVDADHDLHDGNCVDADADLCSELKQHSDAHIDNDDAASTASDIDKGVDEERLRAAAARSLAQSTVASQALSEDLGGMFDHLFAIDAPSPAVQIETGQLSKDGFEIGLQID